MKPCKSDKVIAVSTALESRENWVWSGEEMQYWLENSCGLIKHHMYQQWENIKSQDRFLEENAYVDLLCGQTIWRLTPLFASCGPSYSDWYSRL